MVNLRRKHFFTIVFWTLVFTGCNQNPTTSSSSLTSGKKYFDIAAYFNDQINQLYRDSTILIKTAQINDQTDQHEMKWVDWRKELALFLGSDINKAAFAGKYEADTVTQKDSTGNGMKIISYKAKDGDLKTKLIEVTLSVPTGEVQKIHIVNHTSNILSTLDEELIYIPYEGYIIKTSNDMPLFGGNAFAVKGDFQNREKKYF